MPVVRIVEFLPGYSFELEFNLCFVPDIPGTCFDDCYMINVPEIEVHGVKYDSEFELFELNGEDASSPAEFLYEAIEDKNYSYVNFKESDITRQNGPDADYMIVVVHVY
jgi:hypothetical protein